MVQERRKHKRVPVMMKIDYTTGQESRIGYTTNLSLGGMFVSTEELCLLRQTIPFRFWLPGHKQPFQLEGNVVWRGISSEESNDNLPGIGIRFNNVPINLKKALDQFLDQFDSNTATFFKRNALWTQKEC
jgi:uncharacterized protein (TIGR02266 family)